MENWRLHIQLAEAVYRPAAAVYRSAAEKGVDQSSPLGTRPSTQLLGTLAVPRHLARQLRLQEQKRPGPGRRLPEQQR